MIRRVNIWQELDWLTVLIYLVLILFGWINIYAAVYDENQPSIFDFSQRYGKQMVWILAAITLSVLVLLIDLKFYNYFSYVIYGLTVLLLFMVAFFGKEVNGARSWFFIGSLQIQPTEFAKVGTSLALAKYLSTNPIRLNGLIPMLRSLAPVIFIIFLPFTAITLQPDMGSALVYIALVFVLYREGLPGIYLVCGFLFGFVFVLSLLWRMVPENLVNLLFFGFLIGLIYYNKRKREVIVAIIAYYSVVILVAILMHFKLFEISAYLKHLIALGVSVSSVVIMAFIRPIKYLIGIISLLIVYIGFAYGVNYIFENILENHQRNRIEIFLGQKHDPKKAGYNIEQSKIAIGSGGFSGKGFLKGTQTKYNFVPEQSTDFIFCTIGEEWGFLGSALIVILFLIFLLRLIALAERQRSIYSRIYGYCVASIFFLHFGINIGMTIGLFPVIGIPLPFFSYGGSSLWAFTVLLFVFLRFDASRMELLR